MKIFGIIISIIIFCCSSCNEKQQIFENELEQLELSLSNNEIEELKKSENIALIRDFLRNPYKENYMKTLFSITYKLKDTLISKYKFKNPGDAHIALTFALQKRITKCKIDFYLIKNEIDSFNVNYGKKVNAEINNSMERESKIAKNNFDKFQIGDTINLFFPLKKIDNTKFVYFKNFDFDKYYSDTLLLKCLLLKKTIQKPDNKNDEINIDFGFVLKILVAKNKELDLVDPYYRKGKIFPMSLLTYGRDITK